MKLEYKAVFISPVRNCEKYILNTIEKIISVANIFSDYLIIFIESDSTDNTLNILNDVKQKNNKINVFSLGDLSQKFSSRTKRLEIARNYGLDICIKNNLFNYFNYYISFDSDDVNQGISPEAVLTCFKYNIDSWDVMTANQDTYYDLWALRCNGWMEEDCWRSVFMRPSFLTYDQAVDIHVSSKFIKIPEKFGLLEVDSAYGGFAIYKTSSIKNARYCGVHPDKRHEQVEIVGFNKDLKTNGAKIFINSEMRNDIIKNS